MNTKLFRLIGLPLIALFGVFTLQSCGDDDPVTPDPDEAEALLVHAAPNGPAVDIYVNDAAVATNVTFSQTTGDYLDVTPGSQRIRVAPAGDLPNAVIDVNFNFVEAKHYTIFATDDDATPPTFAPLVFEDDLTEPASGKAHVRIAHLVPGGPAVKLSFAGSGGGALFQNVNFRDMTNLFTPVDAGAVTVRVQDNAASGGGTPLVPDQAVTLEDGGIYTFAVIGDADGDPALQTLVIKHEHD